jgi:hypothetical protein
VSAADQRRQSALDRAFMHSANTESILVGMVDGMHADALRGR